MANMSYCRFHNTRIDMRDCIEALEYEEELSREEAESCVLMFEEIVRYLDDEGIMDAEDIDAVLDEWAEGIYARAGEEF